MKTAEEIFSKHNELWMEAGAKESVTDYVVKAMEEYAEQYASQNKWISTKDANPQEGAYLVYLNNKAFKIGNYYKGNWWSEDNYKLWPSFYQPLTPPNNQIT